MLDPPLPATSSNEVPVIVGVGGSAGSLTPLRQLIHTLPTDSGMAFVVVSHQAATGRSLLPEILSKTTAMAVREIEGETKVLPDHVYLVPRGHSVTVHGGRLAIERNDEPSHVPLAIDTFFRSLAQDQEHRAVGIILSGTGSDGTLGLAAIRSASGLCLVQAPETAEFDGMPTSAIAAQAVDFALPIDEMPSRLLAYVRTLRAAGRADEAAGASSDALERILAVIRTRGGHDFTAYKRDTLMRRVVRRMGIHAIESLSDYVHYLEDNEEEIDALWRDWLIGVSSFFRDPEAFQALATSGLPALLAARSRAHRLRIWVPGCATGEEAYSIAMVVLEASQELGEHFDVQVFATDLDPAAIEIARAGRYPKTISGAISAHRLARFFVEEEHAYRIKKELRDRIVFGVQNVLHAPPFTRVDLISCRNLLIYIVPHAQQALLSTFHYSLNPGGLLLLGSSEHAGSSTELFTTLDKRWRLFQRKDDVAAAPSIHWRPWTVAAASSTADLPRTQRPKLDLTETLHTHLAKRFGPPSVVVDLRGRIQQAHGRVGAYLELPPGRPNLSVVDMARGGLRAPLASALREVVKVGASGVARDVHWREDGHEHALRLTVERIEDRSLPNPLLLVSFEPVAPRRISRPAPGSSSKQPQLQQPQLEEELQHVRKDLESLSELQAANEELASAHEEAQSANEELQSSNEELQTSKEETQSLHEELQTSNDQLAEKLRALETANDDLLNLMNNIEIPVIFLDERLRVKRFTPQARHVARLIDSDVGRPLADLAILVDYPDLLADAQRVLSDLRPREKRASAQGGSWYTVRIRAYRTAGNAVEGLVMSFLDITETRRAAGREAARQVAESVVDAVYQPLLVLDRTLRVVQANRSFYGAFELTPEEVEERPLSELGSGQWNVPRLQRLLERTLSDGTAFESLEIACELPRIGRRQMILSGRPVSVPEGGSPVLVVLGIEDTDPAPVGE